MKHLSQKLAKFVLSLKLSTQSKRIENVKTLPKCLAGLKFMKEKAKIASQKVTLLKGCKIWTEFSTLKPRKIPERGSS